MGHQNKVSKGWFIEKKVSKGWVIKQSLERQGGRSCAGARGAPAEKFGLRRKFYARTYAILS